MAERNVIWATRVKLACIDILYASDFLSMLSKGDQLFMNNSDNELFFYRDGAVYRTKRYEMDYEEFCDYVKIGMDKWGLPTKKSHPALHYHDATEEDDDGDEIPIISTYGKQKLKESFDRNTQKIRVENEDGDNPNLVNRLWLISNDFTTKEQRKEVRDAGFWTPKEMLKAKEEGFAWGELYHFAKEFGFENEEEVLRALELETTDRELLIMTDEGEFESILEAREAQEMGFSDAPTFHKALELRCDNFEDYELVTNEGWVHINELNIARGLGFEDDDSVLYYRLRESSGKVGTLFNDAIRDRYRDIEEKQNLLVFCKQGGLALMEFSEENKLKVWQSAIIMRIHEIELGDFVLLSELERLALECPSDIWGESSDGDVVRRFIYEDERVHVYGTAITADGIFERRTNSNSEDNFRKNDFNKSEEE